MQRLGADRARVRHVHTNLTVTYDYLFEGDDLRIAARVENPSAEADLRAAAFGGLDFTSARTYQLLIRLSDKTDWKYLLKPWKRRLAAMFGRVRYPYDLRPLVYHPVRTQPVEPAEGSGTTLWNCAPGPWGKSKNPDNPLGYAEGEVRFDRQPAVRNYVRRILPHLKKADARGLMFRQLGGYDPKGLQYAAIFHMAPPEVHENVKNLIAGRLEEDGLLVGVTGRPDRWPVHTTIDRCEWLDASPHRPKHLTHMWHCRLRESIRKMGAGMFLLEDFGSQNYSSLKSWPPTRKKKVGEKFGNPVYERVRALNKEELYRWMFRHRMGVLEASHKIGGSRAEMYRRVQGSFMTPEGKWRDDLEPIDRPDQDRYIQERKRREQKEKNSEEAELDALLQE
jgi:hypothetical protein